MTVRRIVLPRDVYDTLELSAYAYGGIGGGSLTSNRNGDPYCAHGLAEFACGRNAGEISPVEAALYDAHIGVIQNDEAVETINRRNGRDDWHRVSFEEWAAELGIVRGES